MTRIISLHLRLIRLIDLYMYSYTRFLLLQAGLYGQVVRWFQNHSYSEKKLNDSGNSAKKRRTSAPVVTVSDEEDNEAIDSHLAELEKEVKKSREKSPDC